MFVGYVVEMEFVDRAKRVQKREVTVYDLGFLAGFGPCLITDQGEVRLDRIVSCTILADDDCAAA